MAGHPCTPEACAATDSADAPVDGDGHRSGPGADQPDYASPPFRFVWSCYLRASVIRRATHYGLHPRWVSNPPLTPSDV